MADESFVKKMEEENKKKKKKKKNPALIEAMMIKMGGKDPNKQFGENVLKGLRKDKE